MPFPFASETDAVDFGGPGSLVVLSSPVLAQGAGGQSPVTIIINGTETPDELKKLIDSVSSQGHPVSVTFAAKPDKAGSGRRIRRPAPKRSSSSTSSPAG